jgi:hypothetical protein
MSINIQKPTDGSFRLVDSISSATVMEADADSKALMFKTATIARTDTSAKNLFILPANALPVRVDVFVGTASDAGTTATISIGKTGSGTYFLNGYSVKSNSGAQSPTTAAHLYASVGSSPVQVTGVYAETGTASTTGGPFNVTIAYYLA